jgi:hypothetical protein
MSGVVVMGALGLAWVGIWAGFKLKHRLKEPIPEQFHSQFEKQSDGWLASVSGKDYQVWKKFGRKVSVTSTLYERAKPHGPAVTIEGAYEKPAGSRDRTGLVTAQFSDQEFRIHLQGREVEFETSEGKLGKLSLDDGTLDSGGQWERDTSYRGPDGSSYQIVRLGQKTVYLCTWGKGRQLYSPLIVGDVSGLERADLQRLLCIAVLWHAVLTG